MQENWEGFRFMGKLRYLKRKLGLWNKEVIGDIRIQKEILEKIKELDDLELEDRPDEDLKVQRNFLWSC